MTNAKHESDRHGGNTILKGVALVLGTALFCSWWFGGSGTTGSGWGALESTASGAPMVSHIAGVTALTYENGGEELLMVLDGRTETMMVYQIKGNNQMELVHRAGVAQMFAEARSQSGGN
jgi:hypothetical protein